MTIELSPIIMDDLHWSSVQREPGVRKIGSNMVARFFKDLFNLNKISSGVNAGEGKEFHSTKWC